MKVGLSALEPIKDSSQVSMPRPNTRLRDRKCNPSTIAQASSMHDTSQLQIWWSLLTWKLKNRVVVECREFEAELADMGCVLARGCDSCTHELEFSESELTDIGCVLARGCDSCTYESRFCEFEVWR